jgi:hypothetical protein
VKSHANGRSRGDRLYETGEWLWQSKLKINIIANASLSAAPT